jgi:hypothetical protein
MKKNKKKNFDVMQRLYDQYGDKLINDVTRDQVYNLFGDEALEQLSERINSADSTLMEADWCTLTFDFDLEYIERLFKKIETDLMIDKVRDYILVQYKTMVNKGMNDFLKQTTTTEPYANSENPIERIAYEAHNRLALERMKKEIRENDLKMFQGIFQDSQKAAKEIKMSKSYDENIERDEIFEKIAETMRPVILENRSLENLLNEKEMEISKLRSENIILSRSVERLSKDERKLGDGITENHLIALFWSAAKIINDGESLERGINKSALARALEKIFGYSRKAVRQSMSNQEITTEQKQKAAEAIKEASPSWAEAILKL